MFYIYLFVPPFIRSLVRSFAAVFGIVSYFLLLTLIALSNEHLLSIKIEIFGLQFIRVNLICSFIPVHWHLAKMVGNVIQQQMDMATIVRVHQTLLENIVVRLVFDNTVVPLLGWTLCGGPVIRI